MACDTDTILPPPPKPFDLGVTTTDNHPGNIDLSAPATVTYTIKVANTGPYDAPTATFTDTETGQGMPAADVTWTATPSDPSASVGGASGTGAISTTVTLPAGTFVIFTVTVPSPFAPGSVVNTAMVQTFDLDPNWANNTATDSHSTSFPF